MISSASLLLTLVLAADTMPPAVVVEEVRRSIAASWQIDESTLVLDWGRLPTMPEPGPRTVLRLGASGRDGWHVVTLVPDSGRTVAIAVRAGISAPRMVAARAVTPGTVLGQEDVTWQETVAWGPPAEAAASLEPVGWEARRSLVPGDLLDESTLRPPRLIDPGDPVTFVWQRGSVRLERVATAQNAGRLGEVVRARVGTVRLEGIVTAPGRARMEDQS